MNPFALCHFVCTRCLNDFSSRSGYYAHKTNAGSACRKRKRRDEAIKSLDASFFKCKLCGFETNRKCLLKDHMTLSHKKLLNNEVDNQSLPTSSPGDKSMIRKTTKKVKHEKIDEAETRVAKVEPTNDVQAKAEPMQESSVSPTFDCSPLITDIKKCCVCHKTSHDTQLVKVKQSHDFYVDSLAKLHPPTSAYVKLLDDGTGLLKIPLFFCHVCQKQIQVAAALFENLNTRESPLVDVLHTYISVGNETLLNHMKL